MSEQQPPWDPYGQRDPRQDQGQPQYPPQQQPYKYQPPYGEQPSRPSFTPEPQYAPPPSEPPYRGQPYQGQPPYPPEPDGQEPYPSQGHRQQSHRRKPPRARKRRRVFLWVFLAIQALFLIWIIVAVATVHTGPTQAQLAQGCYHHNWYPLFKSQADCVQHYGGALNDAGTAGKAIGVGIVIAFWAVVDVILGISYGIYRLARRPA
jgi:hypothetical protein